MMHAFSLFLEKSVEDIGAIHGLDNFIGDIARWEGCIAEPERKGSGLAAVSLSYGVCRRAGINAPRANSECCQRTDCPFVGLGDDTYLDRAAQEGRREGVACHCSLC